MDRWSVVSLSFCVTANVSHLSDWDSSFLRLSFLRWSDVSDHQRVRFCRKTPETSSFLKLWHPFCLCLCYQKKFILFFWGSDLHMFTCGSTHFLWNDFVSCKLARFMFCFQSSMFPFCLFQTNQESKASLPVEIMGITSFLWAVRLFSVSTTSNAFTHRWTEQQSPFFISLFTSVFILSHYTDGFLLFCCENRDTNCNNGINK